MVQGSKVASDHLKLAILGWDSKGPNQNSQIQNFPR